MKNEKSKCNCVEQSCKVGCTKNHTCKVFWCEECEPQRCEDMRAIPNKCTCQYEDKHGLTCPLYVPSKNPMEEKCIHEWQNKPTKTGVTCKKCGYYDSPSQEDKDWEIEFEEWYEKVERISILGNVKEPEKQISVLKKKTFDLFKSFIKKTKQESYEEGVKTFDKELRERIEYLTHYCRSKFSQDCSRNETDEEKSTEMVSKEDLIKTLSTIINSLKND